MRRRRTPFASVQDIQGPDQLSVFNARRVRMCCEKLFTELQLVKAQVQTYWWASLSHTEGFKLLPPSSQIWLSCVRGRTARSLAARSRQENHLCFEEPLMFWRTWSCSEKSINVQKKHSCWRTVNKDWEDWISFTLFGTLASPRLYLQRTLNKLSLRPLI